MTTPSFRSAFAAFATAAVLALPGASAQAQGSYFSIENLGYFGKVSCYATLTDAQTRANRTCDATLPQRDLTLYFIDNNPVFAGFPTYPASAAIAQTNWYSGNGVPTGTGNPNNTNVGFFQLYDDGAGSVTSTSMGWANYAKTVFTAAVSGGPTIPGCSPIPPQDCGRLWNGAGLAGGGIYVNWALTLTASGLNAATFDVATGVYRSTSEPGSVSGTFTGVFQETATGNYYAIDANFNQTSWAVANGFATSSTFGSATVATPEPATVALMATGFVGIAVARRRRTK